MAELTGKTLGNYRVLEQIGRGGMAAVYKGYQPSLERNVALKVIHDQLVEESEEFLSRFQREAKAVAALRHPSIVQVYDFGIDQGIPFMVMEFLEGENLKSHLESVRRSGRRLSMEETVRIFRSLASAVEYAHGMGMTHRDLKPGNVMLTTKGEVVLTDFGIARIVGSTHHTATGAILGTPAYMSPEQGRGEQADERTDIYALGVLLYEMVTGRVPYEADTPLAVILKHISDPLPLPRQIDASIPEAVEQVILKALAKDPADRFQRAASMAAALDAALAAPAEVWADTAMDKTRFAAGAPTPSAAAGDLSATRVPSSAPTTVQPAVSARRGLPIWIWALGGLLIVGAMVTAGVVALRALLGPRVAEEGPTPELPAVSAPTVAPVQTRSLPASPTPLPPTAAPIPASNLIFFDSFTSDLEAGWRWVREDAAHWSLDDWAGYLRITLGPGGLGKINSNPPANLLLRDAPEGEFEISTYLEFSPTSNFQFAGLLIYQDDHNAVQLGRAFCDGPDLCVGNGIYFDGFQQGESGDNYVVLVQASSTAHLRLRSQGSTYTGYYSEDGKEWLTIGEQTIALNPVWVGIIAAQAYAGAETASFDYFRIEALP